MAIAVVDAFGGLAGDIFLGALIDAGTPADGLRETLATLDLPDWNLVVDDAERRAIGCTRARFEGPVETGHRHLPEILARIERSSLHPRAQTAARRAFTLLAEAEAKVHRIAVDEVHFHEVGAADAILDICAVSEALVRLGVERVLALPLPGGSGTVQCAHGELPVPVPAVTELLAGWPIELGVGEGEMITPTAACLLRAWGDPVRRPPPMLVDRTGYGAGTRATSIARVLLGTPARPESVETDAVWELRTHVDDLAGDRIRWAIERLMSAGALDVAVAPVIMKKGRPGHAVTVLSPDDEDARDRLIEVLFEETTTLGVRRERVGRTVRMRGEAVVQTPRGPVRVKLVGDDARPEYEDCARLAREHGVSLQTIYDEVADARRRDD